MRTHPRQARQDFTLTRLNPESNTMTSPNSTYTNQLKSAGDMHEQLVIDLFKDMGSHSANLMHAVVGISGESGELLDAVKKHWAYNKPLDMENIIEELGDIEFYMRALRKLLNISREQVLLANIEKLKKRYPQGKYSDKQAQDRADKAGVISEDISNNQKPIPWGLTKEQLAAVDETMLFDFDKKNESPIIADTEIDAILKGERL